MMTSQTTPDELIKHLGGCGRYQMLISIVAHLMKCLVCFSTTATLMITVTPQWWCDEIVHGNMTTDNGFISIVNDTDFQRGSHNASMYGILGANGTSDDVYFKQCETPQGKSCQIFRFEGTSTLVSEFNLVCENVYIPSLLMSIQGVGALCGNLLSGQIADMFGRKRPFFAAVLLTIIANFVSFLANSWTLIAVTRFFVGLSASAFMTVKYALLSEFTLAQYRAWIIGFPSWVIEASIFVGVAWLLQGWRYIQLLNAIIGLPCLLAWWVIPESFRWHLSHDRKETAEHILRKVAKTNKKPYVTIKQLQDISLGDTKQKGDRKYTILDIFKSRYLIRVTLLMSFPWLALGFVGYGVLFGIKDLSGNFYMNMFLFLVTTIPSRGLCIFLENRIGRRRTAVLIFIVTALGGYAAGVLHYIDTPMRGALVNGFAILANIGIETAWGVIQTMTIAQISRLYYRSIGFGSLSVLARIGSIIAPQFVFLGTKIPGIMFLMCGVISTISMIALLGLDETRNANLSDKISEKHIKEQMSKKESFKQTNLFKDTV